MSFNPAVTDTVSYYSTKSIIEKESPNIKPEMSQISMIAQRCFNEKAIQAQAQPFVKPIKARVKQTHEGYVSETLSTMLTDHLHIIADFIYFVFIDALNDKETRQKLTPLIKLTLDSRFSKPLPASLKKIAATASMLLPEKIEKHAPIFLNLTKALLDDVLCHDELKSSFIEWFVEMLMPYLSYKPSEDLLKGQKQIMLMALKGVESFFDDFSQVMNLKTSWFETPNYSKLQVKSPLGDALEDEIINEMNNKLRQRGFSTIVPNPPDTKKMEKNLFDVTSNLLTALPHSFKGSSEEESMNFLASLWLAKVADGFFSSQTMLHLIDKILNSSLIIEETFNDVAAAYPQTIIDKSFANALDSHFHKLFIHATRMGTTNIINQFCLVVLVQLVHPFTNGIMGKRAAKSLKRSAQTSNFAKILAWCRLFLYHDTRNGHPEYPVLTKLFSHSEAEMQEHKYRVETSIRDNKLYEKMNRIIKEFLPSKHRESDISAKDLKTTYWSYLIADSKIFKTICGNLTNTLYILSQRERLVKLLYCYIAETIRQTLVAQQTNLTMS